jgi:hypothetical protein
MRHDGGESCKRIADGSGIDKPASFLDAGAAPTLRPLARAAATIRFPSSTFVASGFSE